MEQIKAYFTAIENPYYPLHEAVKDTKGCRAGRGKSWLGQAEYSILPADRAQANQGVGKVPKPIPTSLWDTSARKPGNALSRMASRRNGVRDEAYHSRKQQTARSPDILCTIQRHKRFKRTLFITPVTRHCHLSTGQENNIAQPKTDEWFSFSFHFFHRCWPFSCC